MRHSTSTPGYGEPVASLEMLAESAAKTRIICLGHSALDQIWHVEALFSGGSEKLKSLAYQTLGGGMAATAAVAVARLGGQAAFWGRGGEDSAGEDLRAGLVAECVDVSSFRLFPGARSSISGILVDPSGERQIVNFRGSLPENADWLPLREIRDASAVLADPRWPAGAVALFRAARLAKVPTVLDADVADADVFEQLLPLTDHAVFSEPALSLFVGSSDPHALAKVEGYGCRLVAVTRGEQGVIWREQGRTYSRPAYCVAAVDTTGAGDVFHGAYAFGIGAGLCAEDALSLAGAAAALKCTKPGARAGIPALSECIEFERKRR